MIDWTTPVPVATQSLVRKQLEQRLEREIAGIAVGVVTHCIGRSIQKEGAHLTAQEPKRPSLGIGFCPRFGRNEASARTSSFSRNVGGAKK